MLVFVWVRVILTFQACPFRLDYSGAYTVIFSNVRCLVIQSNIFNQWSSVYTNEKSQHNRQRM